jgi:cobyrinic acid a,c-diamide synthase
MTARLVIAGTQSGVGKTTLTAGIIAALRRRGLTVQPFKVGPDYIDPTYHALAAGRPCRNLDAWMTPPMHLRSLFARAVEDADVAVIEGVMGLYDGADYDDETGSTAQVAKLLDAPAILVMDASKMARSAAAVALGCQRFDPEVALAGVIVNRVGSDGHGRGVAAAVAKATGLPALGWLRRDELLGIPERHLGLIPAQEPGRWLEFIQAAGEIVAHNIDINRLLEIARSAPPLNSGNGAELTLVEPRPVIAVGRQTGMSAPQHERQTGLSAPPIIAVARDEAFSFNYEDNLDLLRAVGADIAFFSPIHDHLLPADTAGIILGGGFPEIYAQALAANAPMHRALREVHRRGVPIYAECGGLMYLTQEIRDAVGNAYPMVGLLPGASVMTGRLTLGYRLARSAGASWLLDAGETVRGHEFHYSDWLGRPANLPPAYELLPRQGSGTVRPEGARLGSLLASYVHIHFAARPELAERFVRACASISVGGER